MYKSEFFDIDSIEETFFKLFNIMYGLSDENQKSYLKFQRDLYERKMMIKNMYNIYEMVGC